MRVLLIPLIVLLLVPLALAAGFDISIEPITNRIFYDEAAEFNVTITNHQNGDDAYTISSPDPQWILVKPRITVDVPAQSSSSFTLIIDPKSTISLGPKVVIIRVRSVNYPIGEAQKSILEANLPVYVKSYDATGHEYVCSIAMNTSMPLSADPREIVPMDIYYRNRNARDNSGNMIKVMITSELFSKEYNISLGPLEEKTTQILAEIPPYTEPGTYKFTTALYCGDDRAAEVERQLQVEGFSELKPEEMKKSFLFRNEFKRTIYNDGNAPNTFTVKVESNWFRKLFTSTYPSAEYLREDGVSYFMWTEDVEPRSSIEVTRVENYRLIPIVIIILAVVTLLYFLLRSPLVLSKQAKVIGKEKEGISELKIRLFIRNRSSQQITGIEVIDRVAGLVEIEKKKQLGTIAPTKIVKRKKMTYAHWNIESIDPFEERIITYTVKSQLKLAGDIFLPSMTATFITTSGKKRKTHSNELTLAN